MISEHQSTIESLGQSFSGLFCPTQGWPRPFSPTTTKSRVHFAMNAICFFSLSFCVFFLGATWAALLGTHGHHKFYEIMLFDFTKPTQTWKMLGAFYHAVGPSAYCTAFTMPMACQATLQNVELQLYSLAGLPWWPPWLCTSKAKTPAKATSKHNVPYFPSIFSRT